MDSTEVAFNTPGRVNPFKMSIVGLGFGMYVDVRVRVNFFTFFMTCF